MPIQWQFYKTAMVLVFVSSCGAAPLVKARRVLLHQDTDVQEIAENLRTPENSYIDYRIHSPGGWEKQPIVLSFEVDVPLPIRIGVTNAAATWNQAVGFELLTFSGAATNFKGQLYDRLNDGIATIGVENYWCRTRKPAQVLATTIYENSKLDPHKIISGDLIFNGENYFIDDALQTSINGDKETVDAESLALHELGHLLGLAHSDYKDGFSVMNPSLYIGEGITSRQLSPFDLALVRFLYVPGSDLPALPESQNNDVGTMPPRNPAQPTSRSVRPVPPRPCDWTSD